MTLFVVAAILVATAGAALAAWLVHDTSENELLERQVRQGAASLTSAVGSIQTPLAVGANEATRSGAAGFADAMTPLVGKGKLFVSAALWAPGSTTALAAVGDQSALSRATPERVRAFLQRAAASRPQMAVTGFLHGSDARLGYAVNTSGAPTSFIAYAEAALPKK